uniref:Uncharacterized protein n=2 Tax=Triticum urartu TaxID=4572 RepID=A0A8R7Q436_TRIUA
MALQYDPVQNWRLDQSAVRQSRLRESCGWQTGQQYITEAEEKPTNAAFGPGRPHRLHSEPIGSEVRPKPPQGILLSQTQRRTKPTIPNRPLGRHDENQVQTMLELAKNAKVEATKQKLEEGYQEFNNAGANNTNGGSARPAEAREPKLTTQWQGKEQQRWQHQESAKHLSL